MARSDHTHDSLSLTTAGVAVASGAVGLGVLGWALGYVALVALAIGGIVALLVGAIATWGTPGLHVDRLVGAETVERGRSAHTALGVRNPTTRPSRPCIAIDNVAGTEMRLAVPSLAPGRHAALPHLLPTSRRGPLVVGPLSIGRRDPLGLWQVRRPVGTSITLTVQPRVHPLLLRTRGRARHLDGPMSDSAANGSLTFSSLREYTAGDDIRRVHWRTSARTGTLMVREHVDSSLPSTVIVLDDREDRYRDDDFESAVDVAASLVAAVEVSGFPIRLMTSSGLDIVVRSGQRPEAIKSLLATVQPSTSDADLAHVTSAVLRTRERDTIYAISGATNDDDLAQITSMARRFSTRALITIRPDDAVGRLWPSGTHLSGPTAEFALRSWMTAS